MSDISEMSWLDLCDRLEDLAEELAEPQLPTHEQAVEIVQPEERN